MDSKFLVRACLASLAMVAMGPAVAAEFRVQCSYTNDNLRACASAVADIVTDKFTDKFPVARFEIFVHSHVTGFETGGFAAYAVAGVVPRASGQFPANRFLYSMMNGAPRRFSQIDLAKSELEVYRAAVKNLMDRCEISPECDVYVPFKP